MWVGLPVNGCIIVRAIGGSFADRREKLHQIGLVEKKEAGDQAGLKKPGWPQKTRLDRGKTQFRTTQRNWATGRIGVFCVMSPISLVTEWNRQMHGKAGGWGSDENG